MDKFTTRQVTVEILEDIHTHRVYRVRIDGVEQIAGYHFIDFLRRIETKEGN